ncbi:hypothetical protein B0189_00670 [Moraxella cuniculi]|nr:hypothetical protein B0189_00670 [Moraxella cuniculi]
MLIITNFAKDKNQHAHLLLLPTPDCFLAWAMLNLPVYSTIHSQCLEKIIKKLSIICYDSDYFCQVLFDEHSKPAIE